MSDEDADSFINDDDESSEEDLGKKRRSKASASSKKKKRRVLQDSLIDDAAELSGEEQDEDDDEEEDEEDDNNDYVRDGFVVDEAEEDEPIRKKKRPTGDLEDSDDDDDGDDDDDDDDDDEGGRKKLKEKGRIKKLRDVDVLDEDDLVLIDEARGVRRQADYEREEEERRHKLAIRAQNEEDLRRGLFDDEAEQGESSRKKAMPKKLVEQFDEDGMDDFIDDDIGDQHDIRASGRTSALDDDYPGGVNEAQLLEASEIFGTDYLEFMGGAGDEGEEGYEQNKFRERGVGVDLGVDSEEESDDDELFGDDEEEGDLTGQTSRQRAEAKRLKREKKNFAKAERRREALQKQSQRRKAMLRRAFEPVQLIENFCTERDDEIRAKDAKDAPERFFDWKTPFHGPEEGTDISEEEEEEALWIMSRIPEVGSEFFSPQIAYSGLDTAEQVEKQQRAVLDSIIHALRFMHKDQLEPEFIKRYRADIVTSLAVQNNLYKIMDQDTEWDKLIHNSEKTETLLEKITAAAENEETKGAEEDNLMKLREELQSAQEKLDSSIKDEERLQGELKALENGGEDDDDDELFGDDDDDQGGEDKEQKKSSITSHLNTVQSLVQERAERVASLVNLVKIAEAKQAELLASQAPVLLLSKKLCRKYLWNSGDYRQYLSSLTDARHITDLNSYLSLTEEGSEALRSKHAPGGTSDARKKRSRRFDRDYYRTCVSEGLRSICYQFCLSPFRAGIKLEDSMTLSCGFSYDRTLPGEEETSESGPRNWVAPLVKDDDPTTFASKLVGSGDLVLLSTSQGGEMDPDHPEMRDPLRGSRYVAAMELAYEPRIRRHLRAKYRELALLTTRPTAKGMDNIDYFHQYYGLHLIHDKPVKEHFPMDERESEARRSGLTTDERKELDEDMKKRERQSCLQYLNVMKAENSGDISVQVHLPFLREGETGGDWFKLSKSEQKNLENQNISELMKVLEDVYLPPEGDTDAWNDERKKILLMTLTNFLLPQFEAETRRELREASVKIGVLAAGEALKEMAMEGPYRPSALLGENRFLVPTGDLPMVGVCVSADTREASYLASVNERGEMTDHLAVPGGTKIDGDKMREKVIMFLIQARPSAVLVGTSGGLESRMVQRKLGDLLTQATERWNNRLIQGPDEDEDEYFERLRVFEQMHPNHDGEDDDEKWKCNVDLIDDNVAQLFGRSVRGKKEFPDMAVNLKCAISIARHAKDPLAELAYAWNVASDAGVFGTEMLYLNVHPLQKILPRTLLLRQYERVLCTAIAEIGVDINTACSYDHILPMLSFVPGLGPRKAASLRQNLARIGGVVESRRAMLAKRLLGPVVYNNAVAFLRIRDVDQLRSQFLHPLDDTRLHPDVYHRNNWAVKIAIDALELGESAEKGLSSDRDDLAITSLRDVMQDSKEEVKKLFEATKLEWETHFGSAFNVGEWNPRVNVPTDRWRDKVEELDLEAFAEIIERDGLGKWLSHLMMIKWEFRLPFDDPRTPMEPLSGDKLFRLLTGEIDETLCPGKEVTGKVVKNGDFGSRIKLEGEIPAFIPLRNLSDEHVESAEDIVQVGSMVTAIITEVKKDHMSVDLSLRMEDFRKAPSSWERPASLRPLDTFFDRQAALKIEDEKSKKREEHLSALQLRTKIGDEGEGTRTGKVTRRACVHPAFRNAKQDEVDRELRQAAESMVGEALLRPSSKSSDSLAVHWVVRPGVVKVIEVIEEDKDTDASIGNILKIKNDSYGSIDELLGRYIAPMNDRVEELIHHRKFVDLPEDELDEKLAREKKECPKGIFYNLCWNEQHPGYASLRFILSSTVRHQPIGITPDGFLWGTKTYSKLDHLLNDFKKNPRGPSVSSSRSAVSGSSSRAMASSSVGSKTTVTDSTKPSRWGAKPAPPPRPPPAWGPAPAAGGFGAPSAGGDGWGAPSAAGGFARPPPVPPQYQPPPPAGPPSSFGQQPPPPFARPPPPPPPPPDGFGRPPPFAPPPPGGPPPHGYPPRLPQ